MLKALTVQEVIQKLQAYWAQLGCAVLNPYDLEVGAGTFHPATIFGALGKKPWNVVFVQISRRPADGRYGDNPNRVYRHHQLQVVMKPIPENIQYLYLESLRAVGIDYEEFDIRFVEDNWQAPSLGASGLGWEIWCNGMEITQYTYFLKMGGQTLAPLSVELAYGLERMCMYIQNVENVFDLKWNEHLTYGDLFKEFEYEFSKCSFEYNDANVLNQQLEQHLAMGEKLAKALLPYPALDMCAKASHTFNLLDALGTINYSARVILINAMRALAQNCCEIIVNRRQ